MSKTKIYAKAEDRYTMAYHTIVRCSSDKPFTFRMYKHTTEINQDYVPVKHRVLVAKGLSYYEALRMLAEQVQTF